MYNLTVFLLVCVDVMVMSYSYEVSCSGTNNYNIPDVFMLNSVGNGDIVLMDTSFKFGLMCVSECCVWFASLDVV